MSKERIFGDYDRPKCNIIIHEFSRNNNKKGQTLSDTAVAQAGQHVPICYKVMIKCNFTLPHVYQLNIKLPFCTSLASS